MPDHTATSKFGPTLAEARRMQARKKKAVLIDLTDSQQPPVVRFTGVWSNADIQTVNRVLLRRYKIYRSELRKVGVNGR